MALTYPTVDDVLALHERIVERGDGTESGVRRPGDVEYALTFVEDGHFGETPETFHEKAAHLVRLLVANHPFVDGNKRTALATVVVSYGLNGYALDYDDDVRGLLKSFATGERSVGVGEATAYLRQHAEPVGVDEFGASADPGGDDVPGRGERSPRGGLTDEARDGGGTATDGPPADEREATDPEREALVRRISERDFERHRDIYEKLEDE